MRGGDDAHVHLLRICGTDLFDLALLDQSQHPHLQVGRHLADFIQKDRPAIGDLHFALLVRQWPR